MQDEVGLRGDTRSQVQEVAGNQQAFLVRVSGSVLLGCVQGMESSGSRGWKCSSGFDHSDVTAGLRSLDFIPLEMGLVEGRILAETNSRVSFHLSWLLTSSLPHFIQALCSQYSQRPVRAGLLLVVPLLLSSCVLHFPLPTFPFFWCILLPVSKLLVSLGRKKNHDNDFLGIKKKNHCRINRWVVWFLETAKRSRLWD